MELTTGAILRRITRTNLSVSAHKLATVILDGIAGHFPGLNTIH